MSAKHCTLIFLRKDDEYWLPMVLDGKSVEGSFTFDAADKMLTHDVREV